MSIYLLLRSMWLEDILCSYGVNGYDKADGAFKMTARILTGSKQEIARKLADLDGDVREAIVFVEEPVAASAAGGPLPAPQMDEDIFAEMEPYMVQVGHLDDSRETIYTRMAGE